MTIEDCDPALTISHRCAFWDNASRDILSAFLRTTMPERREQCSLLWIAGAAAHWYAAPLDYLTI